MPDALVVFVIPLLLLAMFAVVAIVSVSAVRGLTTSSFRSGMRLLLVQCTGLLGAGVGFVAGWLAHAYVPSVSAGAALWVAMLVGTALGGAAGALFGLLATRPPRDAPAAPTTAYDDRS